MPAKPAQPAPTPPPADPPLSAEVGPDADDSGVADAEELALIRTIQRDGPAHAAAWTALLKRYQDRLYAVCLKMAGNPDTALDLTQDTMVKIIQGLPGYDARSKLSTWMIRVAMNTCFSYLRGQKLRRHASLDSILESGAATERGRGTPPGSEPSHDRPASHPSRQPGPRLRDDLTVSRQTRPDTDPDPSQDRSTRRTPSDQPTDSASPDGALAPDKAETMFSPRLFTGPGGAGSGGPGGWREQSREQTPEQSVELSERRRTVAAALASLAPDQRAILVLRDVQGFDYDQIGEALDLAVGTVKSRLFRARVALREAIEKAEGSGE